MKSILKILTTHLLLLCPAGGQASTQLNISSQTTAQQLDRLQKRLPPGVVVRVNSETDIGLPPERPVPEVPQHKPQCTFPANQAGVVGHRPISLVAQEILRKDEHSFQTLPLLRGFLDKELFQFCQKSNDHLSRFLLIRYLYQSGDFSNVRQALANLLMIVNSEGIRADRIHGLTHEQTAELLKIGLVVGWCDESSARRKWITAFTAFARKIRTFDPFWRTAHFILDVSDPDPSKAKANFKAWEEGEDLDKDSFIYETVSRHIWGRDSSTSKFPRTSDNILDWVVGIAFNLDFVTEFLKDSDIKSLSQEQLFFLVAHKRIDIGFRLMAAKILSERGLLNPIAFARLFEEINLQPHLYYELIKSDGRKVPEFLTDFEISTLLYESSKRAEGRVFFLILNMLYSELQGDFLSPASGYVSWQLDTIVPTPADSWFAPKALRILSLMGSKKASYWKTMLAQDHPDEWPLVRVWWYLSPQWKNIRHVRKAIVEVKPALKGRLGAQYEKGLLCLRMIYQALGVPVPEYEWGELKYPATPNLVSALAKKVALTIENDDKLGFLLLSNHGFKEAVANFDAEFFFYLIKGLIKFEGPQVAFQVARQTFIQLGL